MEIAITIFEIFNDSTDGREARERYHLVPYSLPMMAMAASVFFTLEGTILYPPGDWRVKILPSGRGQGKILPSGGGQDKTFSDPEETGRPLEAYFQCKIHS